MDKGQVQRSSYPPRGIRRPFCLIRVTQRCTASECSSTTALLTSLESKAQSEKSSQRSVSKPRGFQDLEMQAPKAIGLTPKEQLHIDAVLSREAATACDAEGTRWRAQRSQQHCSTCHALHAKKSALRVLLQAYCHGRVGWARVHLSISSILALD